MQIYTNNSLPVIAGTRPEPVLRRPAPPRTEVTSEFQPNVIDNPGSDQGSRRAPLFLQSNSPGNFTRTGETAVRTYRDVALAGEPGELVNRLNVTA
ncbi:MAG: hypothetical protein GC149_05740 [Gammaproteobacteria bacterium]|nr:hypothetical protein [Gammaproteobacteria bacterium]